MIRVKRGVHRRHSPRPGGGRKRPHGPPGDDRRQRCRGASRPREVRRRRPPHKRPRQGGAPGVNRRPVGRGAKPAPGQPPPSIPRTETAGQQRQPKRGQTTEYRCRQRGSCCGPRRSPQAKRQGAQPGAGPKGMPGSGATEKSTQSRHHPGGPSSTGGRWCVPSPGARPPHSPTRRVLVGNSEHSGGGGPRQVASGDHGPARGRPGRASARHGQQPPPGRRQAPRGPSAERTVQTSGARHSSRGTRAPRRGLGEASPACPDSRDNVAKGLGGIRRRGSPPRPR